MTVVTSAGSSAGGDLYVNIESGNVLVFKNLATANGNVVPDHMFFRRQHWQRQPAPERRHQPLINHGDAVLQQISAGTHSAF